MFVGTRSELLSIHSLQSSTPCCSACSLLSNNSPSILLNHESELVALSMRFQRIQRGLNLGRVDVSFLTFQNCGLSQKPRVRQAPRPARGFYGAVCIFIGAPFQTDALSIASHCGGHGSPIWPLVTPHGPVHVYPPISGGAQQPGVTASV